MTINLDNNIIVIVEKQKTSKCLKCGFENLDNKWTTQQIAETEFCHMVLEKLQKYEEVKIQFIERVRRTAENIIRIFENLGLENLGEKSWEENKKSQKGGKQEKYKIRIFEVTIALIPAALSVAKRA